VDLARQHLGHGAGLAIAVALMLALAACTLRTMFMNGGDRHFALRTEQELQTERLTPQGQFKGRGPNRFAMGICLAALRRDSAGHNGGKLLAHLLGAREHWTQQVLGLGSVVLRAATGLPVLPGAALMSIMIACVDGARRWKASVDAPHAFPVGRLAWSLGS
jgi:hypothetical protein